jgi:signal transduction histidine kinase/ActR/RegA family two-component response regulator
MTLRNSFRLVTLSVVTLLVGVGIVAAFGTAYTNTRVEEAMAAEELLAALGELRILGGEQAATPSARVVQQWRARYQRVRAVVEAAPGATPEARELLEGMPRRFDQLVDLSRDGAPATGGPLRLRKQAAANLDLEAQRLIDWASAASRESKAGIVPHLAAVGTAVGGVMLVVAFLTIATLLVTSRRTLDAVAELEQGAAAIAAGQLGIQVRTSGPAEMAALAASVNRMSLDLRAGAARVQERTAQLEAEIGERTRVEGEHARLQGQYLQSQKMEAIGLLAGGVAHDFNNILSVILASGSMLKTMCKDAEASEYLDEIVRSAKQAADLTRGLLAFGRKQDFTLRPTELNEYAADAARFLQRVIGEDVGLIVERSPSPVYALVDRSQVQQVLMNLAANARDAMPRGGRLTLAVSSQPDGEDGITLEGPLRVNAVLRVTDTGAGMAPEVLKRIFEPFFTTKEKGRGTGLGLSITHGIVRQHHGQIVCRSAPGEGTSFVVYLPAHDPDDDRPEALADSPVLPQGRGETILLAEDDPMVMSSTSRICSSNGYRVLQARDGVEAVELFTAHREAIDLVLLDAVMPRATGREAWAEIRSLKPGIRGCFVSGYAADPVNGAAAVDASVPFLGKPFTPDELLGKIREILDGRRTSREGR